MKNIQHHMRMMMGFALPYIGRFENERSVFIHIRSRLGTYSNRGDDHLSDPLAEELSHRFGPFAGTTNAHNMVILSITRSAPVRFDINLLDLLS